MGRVKRYFLDRGLGPEDLIPAFVFHETISIAFAASTWIAAYAIEPTRTVLRPLRGTKAAKAMAKPFGAALELATKQTAKAVTRIPALKRASAERLTVSLAESLMFRGSIKPITFGGKLWLSYEFVKWLKRDAVAAAEVNKGKSETRSRV
ncbi:hypothetical protein BE221DRAFT_158917 [Ostreococcus tauri]|uniref:Uncharacterized protein n=1 Tax=Ostreococcus tauri TaxID=70448 RepID=A0A1Y5ICZ4_OSTTA|nr:hypothetical protein BE221DRAFT_158917 [Ostreococcus tauri]